MIRQAIFIVAIMGSLLDFTHIAMAADRDRASSGQKQTLIHNGIERSYLIRVPSDRVSNNERIPLVLVLHGGGGNAENVEKMTGFTEKARSESFFVVYPEGTGRRKNKLLTWNAGHCCGHAMETGVDDVGFINTLIDKLVESHPIDPKRIYATGMSNGAMMTHRLGIELSIKFAAIAPVVGTLFGDEKRPEHPVSVITLNGRHDKSVPHQGGPPGGYFTGAWDGTPARPALDQTTFWANVNGCTGEPTQHDHGTFTRWQYPCPSGRAVELYIVEDNGHAWPGGKKGSFMGDKPSSSFNATDVIWNFFKTRTR